MIMDSKLTSMDVKSANAIMVSKFLHINYYDKSVKCIHINLFYKF